VKALSHENISRLLWLGRYSERVYTTLRNFAGKFDAMIDDEKNSHDFAKSYCFDENNPDSVYSALIRAYDNAIELREEIGSDTFSYVQLAVYEMNKAKLSDAPLLQLQKVIDNIAAFWGVADDIIEDENVRSIIKLGKRIERVDLYARFNADSEDIRREVRRLGSRILKAGIVYDAESLERLKRIAENERIDTQALMKEAESLVNI
jgi:uncharacterized alpha-E superfamily protein